MTLSVRSFAPSIPSAVLVDGQPIPVIQRLNRRLDVSLMLRLADDSVAHLATKVPNSLQELGRLYNLMRVLKPPSFARILGPVCDPEGEMIGFRREFIAEHDPYWRRIYPNLDVKTWLQVGIILCGSIHRFHTHTNHSICDLKPENICFRRLGGRWWPVPLDFDVAQELGQRIGDPEEGTTVGTGHYMPMEQAICETATPSVDEYSLAVTLASIAIGCTGFGVTGDTLGTVYRRINAGAFPYRSLLERTLPERVVLVLNVSMSRHASDRYGTCRELGRALRKALRSLTEEERSRRLPPVPEPQQLVGMALPAPAPDL